MSRDPPNYGLLVWPIVFSIVVGFLTWANMFELGTLLMGARSWNEADTWLLVVVAGTIALTIGMWSWARRD